MSQQKPGIYLNNSEIKNLSVVVIDPDVRRAVEHETKTELDPYLQRVNVFFASKIRDARDLAKSRGTQIAIFPAEVDGMDFVSIQNEMKNAHSSIKMVPLVDQPTLEQFRESRKIGGILDFNSSSAMTSYEALRNVIVSACRDVASKTTLEADFTSVTGLQTALLLKNPGMEETKATSARLCSEILPLYDLSVEECTTILLAEKIYFPELESSSYSRMLAGSSLENILGVLGETGSWVGANKAPTSTAGFVITAANAIADWHSQGLSSDEIVSRFQSRPAYIKHISMRGLAEEALRAVLDQLETSTSQRYTG